MANKILIANWKMNPKTAVEAKKIFSETQKGLAKIQGVDVYICPPVVFLPELSKVTKKVVLGAQDLFYEKTGAYTGQVSPHMVIGYKAKLAILGHSERRALGESNDLLARKARHVLNEGMSVALCVGEKERTDEGDYLTFVREELEAVLAVLKKNDLKRFIIAYEPMWAIGKSADDALDVSALYEMVLFIRKILIEKFGRAPAEKVPILYGASVKVENAQELVEKGGVDGLLVGSASLDPKQFLAIAKVIVTKK